MKSQRRYAARRALVPVIAVLCAFLGLTQLATTQEKPKPASEPAGKTDSKTDSLIKTTPQDSILLKSDAQPRPTPPKAAGEVEGPVLVNSDLITVTVTVTDSYGRYVSGLAEHAFSIFDNKQQQ